MAKLPDAVRREVMFLVTLMHFIAGAGNKQEALRICAAQSKGARGYSAFRLARKWEAYARSGKDWRVLVNKAKAGPAWWQSQKRVGLPKDFIEWWRELCERSQRCDAAAHRLLKRIWETGVDDSVSPPRRITAIPGYANWPKARPDGDLPFGWDYRNVNRFSPTKFEKAVTRQGRSAGANFRPLVYTTRKNLWVGSHYLFDDIWHDHFVNVLDTRKTGRPLEFHGLDLFSACKFAWGMRVRTRNDETGVMDGLREENMRYLLASVFAQHGYSPRGTVLVVEHGTAAVREQEERLLFDLSGGKITVSRSGMEGAAAFAGQYAGRAKGNFRFKAALESLGNLIHNEMGFLPGQTGLSVERRPEGLHGLLKHNDALLNAMVALAKDNPDRAAMLRFDLLEFRQFQNLALDIYQRINDRTEHDLEGWGDLVVQAERNLKVAATGCGVMRRMSPNEVWQRGNRELVKLPPAGIAMLLGHELGTERVMKRAMFEFSDKEIDSDDVRFEALGLIEGEKYFTVLNPFAPNELFAFKANGSFVGVCPRIASVCKGDAEALHRACGRAARIEAELLAPVAKRGASITRNRIENAQHNARVIAGTDLEQTALTEAAEHHLTNIGD